MVEEHTADDQSHYEISLTAGQAFIAFVLLLLSLAASFAFGLMLGKGQADERLVVRKETPVITEAGTLPKKSDAGEIVELGVATDDFQETNQEPEAIPTDSSVTVAPMVEDEVATTPVAATPAPVTAEPAPAPVTTAAHPPAHTPAPAAAAPAKTVPHLAQLLSTGDQKTAEGMAVKLINRGFSTAYVERGSTEKGPVYRVRVRFDSEGAARAAEPKLKEFSKDVWITSR